MSNQTKRAPDEKELSILKKLAENPEVSKIAARKRFKCSARVLERWLEDYSIEWVSAEPGKHPTDKQLERLRSLAKDPTSGIKCAAQDLNISTETINKWIKRYGIEWVAYDKKLSARKRKDQHSTEDILKVYDELRRPEATATRLGISVNRVYSVLRDNRIRYGSSQLTNLVAHMTHVDPEVAPAFVMQYDPKNDMVGWSWACDELDVRGWVAANDDSQAKDRIAQNLAKVQARKKSAYI